MKSQGGMTMPPTKARKQMELVNFLMNNAVPVKVVSNRGMLSNGIVIANGIISKINAVENRVTINDKNVSLEGHEMILTI
jgi:hypothetical protein